MTPATPKDFATRAKLQELINRGSKGEADSAQNKLTRLEGRVDFSAGPPPEAGDMFAEVHITRSNSARPVCSFPASMDSAASYIKWAISNRFDVASWWKNEGRGTVLMMEIDAPSVPKLAHVCQHIATSFGALWAEFNRLPGATASDARLFMRGLYDGMMNDERAAGERLPSRIAPAPVKKARGRRNIVEAPALGVHPYAVALGLGRRIRLSAPVEQLTGEFHALTRKAA